MKYLRKLLSGVTAFAVSLTALPFSPLSMTTNAAEIIYGDVNGDGKVNIFDLTLLKREINSPGTTNISQKAGDVNSDGILNIYDVREVLNFLLGKTDVFSANAGAVVSDDTENLTVFPAVSNSDYQLSEGNSKPFETSPIDGLIVSAEKNALDYDGQLKITEMSETDGKALNETLTESGILMIEGWNINANLKADEYLPGTFHSDYDLTTLDMPEEMYKDVVVLRVDDDGNIQQYAVERNGSHLSWDSSQNSFLVLGLITTTGLAVAGKVMTLEALYWTACVVAGVTIIDYAAVCDKESLWNQKEMQSLHFYETDDFVIWYSTEDENFYRREKRIRDTENKTYQEAYNDALWIYGSDYATKLNGIKKLNEKAIEIQKTMLADDAQYQADIAARENLPADVILLADYLKTAKDYLETEQKTGKLGYKPDILLTPNAKDLGNEQKPDVFWRNPYIAVKRDQSMMYDTQSYPEKTAPGQLYGTKFRAELADDMLITVTHEMFHIHQHKKYNANDKTHLDFTEFSANILEMQCAEYYKEHQRITTPYKNENIGGYETYAIPIDRNDIASGTFDFDENVLKAHGYTLAEFYEYLKEKTGKQMTAWKLVDAYSKQSNSVIKAIMKVYGINSKKDLSDYWKGYLQSIPDKLGNRTKEIQNHTSDSQAAMPSYLRKIVLSKNHQSEKITVNAANFTAKLGHIYCTDTDNYSVLFVRDKGFSSSLPTFGFAFSKPSGITQSGQTISGGIALNFKNWDGYFYERQGSGNSGTGTYTAWLLEPPEAPVLVYDEEIHAFHLNLQEDRSQAGKNKITDCFRVIWKVNGIEVYSQLIDFDNWTDDIIVYPKELKVSLTDQFELSATIQEYIAPVENYKAFKGPESDAAVLKFGSDVLVIDTDLSYSSYYSIGKGGINLKNSKPHFTLNEDGSFVLTVPDYAQHDYMVDNSIFAMADFNSPWYYDTIYEMTGVTVSGILTDMSTPSAWTAEVAKSSVSTFRYYHEYNEYNDEKELYNSENTEWKGSFSGKVQGVVEYSEQPYNNNPDSGMIIATIKLSLDVPLTSTKGETTADRSVVFTGSYTKKADS